jgi:hypothetical protein
MGSTYKVANVEEAVELAYKFKQEGTYDWFRGQVVDYWPHSTLYRKQTEDEIKKAELQYELFTTWIGKTEELNYLLNPANNHELEAIMQHYGLPTHYIDFTTNPAIAGFFASDTNKPISSRYSCIYCLNTEDLLSFWEVVKTLESRENCKVQKIVIDVDNLWRLQAQSGVFLLCNYNLEEDYPIDKIIFPYSGYPSYPTKKIVYPDHKSALELLLDQYFDLQRASLFHEEMKDQTYFIPWKEFPKGFYLEAFKEPESIKILSSWTEQQEFWKVYESEKYHDTTGTRQILRLNNLESPEEIKRMIIYGIKQVLRSSPKVRNSAIDWVLEDIPKNVNHLDIATILMKTWNGMRSLPFDDSDISEACGNAVHLHLNSKEKGNYESTLLKVFTDLFGPSMRVGFSNEDTTGSYGYASFNSINAARAIDLSEVLIEEYKFMGNSIPQFFQLIYNPKLTFDFNKFKNFFVREVIPSQVAWAENLIIFNPMKLTIFGIP